MRITGGELRGRALEVGAGVRPTEGRVREALFSIWQAALPGARFLDLFAGSGVVGFEALSRGAAAVTFVEQSPRVARALERAAAQLGARGSVRVWRASLPGASRRLVERPERFDLAFADPPYAFAEYGALLRAAGPLVALGGELALEHSARSAVPGEAGELALVDRRTYGDTALSFYRPRADAASVGEEEGELLEVDPEVDVLHPHSRGRLEP